MDNFNKYESLIVDLKAQHQLHEIKNSVEQIENILYKNNSVPTRIAVYVDNFFKMLNLEREQYKTLLRIKSLENELKLTNLETNKKKVLENALKKEQQNFYKTRATIGTISVYLENNLKTIKVDSATLKDSEKSQVNLELNNIKNNFIHIENKATQKAQANNSILASTSPTTTNSKEKEVNQTKSIEPDYKRAYEDLKEKYDKLHNNYEDLQAKYNKKTEEYDTLKADIENLKQEIAQMKNDNIKNKLKNGFKKTKRKVIAVKDYFVDFAKEHKVATAFIIITLVGLTSSTIVLGNPLAGVGRIASSLYNVFNKMNITGPLDPLHKLNEFIFGKIQGASFDSLSGIWSVNGKVLNNLNVFGTTLRTIEAAAFAAPVVYNAAKLSKKAWLKVAQTKYCQKLKDKIANKLDKTFGKIKDKIIKKYKSNSNFIEDIYNTLLEFSDEELQEFISDLIEIIQSGIKPEEFKDYTDKELNTILKTAKKIYAEKKNEREGITR